MEQMPFCYVLLATKIATLAPKLSQGRNWQCAYLLRPVFCSSRKLIALDISRKEVHKCTVRRQGNLSTKPGLRQFYTGANNQFNKATWFYKFPFQLRLLQCLTNGFSDLLGGRFSLLMGHRRKRQPAKIHKLGFCKIDIVVACKAQCREDDIIRPLKS